MLPPLNSPPSLRNLHLLLTVTEKVDAGAIGAKKRGNEEVNYLQQSETYQMKTDKI